MLSKTTFRIVAGIIVISAAVVLIRGLSSFRPISDAEIEPTLYRVSVLQTAQYIEIINHFPNEAAAIREEAKRLEKLRRRGVNVSAGALVAFTRDVMAPRFRAIHQASEDTLDIALARVLDSVEIFRGDPICGPFLLNGTFALSREQRQQYWEIQARDTPVIFDAMVEGLTEPQVHSPATSEAWGQLYALYLQQGHPASHVDTFRAAFSPNRRNDQINKPEFCTAYLGIIGTLVGTRFPGSAAIKSNRIISAFGVSP